MVVFFLLSLLIFTDTDDIFDCYQFFQAWFIVATYGEAVRNPAEMLLLMFLKIKLICISDIIC